MNDLAQPNNHRSDLALHPRAAYIHVPFCRSKCFYCDFNSYPRLQAEAAVYADALIAEVAGAPRFGHKLSSVYFGGGTPTILPADDLVRVLDSLRERMGMEETAEVTVEANPGTVDGHYLSRLRENGFNRLSIGVQSLDDAMLGRLGRIHTSIQAFDAVAAAREAGFANISIDLMYALPDQSLVDWERTLAAATKLAPEHISLYELTVEEGTIFGNLKARCSLSLPDEDLQIEMYRSAIAKLGEAGYEHYEISNYALPVHRSRHNQVYWRNEAYYGFGAGASGYTEGTRYTNLRRPLAYLEAIASAGSAVETSETVTGRQLMGESVMLGIRMLDGLDLAAFKSRFGVSIEEVYGPEVTELIDRGLIEVTGTRMRVTRNGLLVANDVAAEFL